MPKKEKKKKKIRSSSSRALRSSTKLFLAHRRGEGDCGLLRNLHTLKSKRRDHIRSDVEVESQTNCARQHYPPVSKSTKLKTFYECENLTAIWSKNCSPKMPKIFNKKWQQIWWKKCSPQRNAQNLAGKEIFSSHGTAQEGGGRRRPLPLSRTLIHSWTFLPVLWVSLPCWPVIKNTSGHLPSYFITYWLLVIDFLMTGLITYHPLLIFF